MGAVGPDLAAGWEQQSALILLARHIRPISTSSRLHGRRRSRKTCRRFLRAEETRPRSAAPAHAHADASLELPVAGLREQWTNRVGRWLRWAALAAVATLEAQEVFAGLDASLAAAKTGRTVFQSQKLSIPGLRRLHHITEAQTALAEATTAATEVCLLVRPGLEARGHPSLPTAAGTPPLLDSQQQPEPTKPSPVGGAAAGVVADQRGSLLLLSALSLMSRPVGGHLGDVQRLRQLLMQEAMSVL